MFKLSKKVSNAIYGFGGVGGGAVAHPVFREFHHNIFPEISSQKHEKSGLS